MERLAILELVPSVLARALEQRGWEGDVPAAIERHETAVTLSGGEPLYRAALLRRATVRSAGRPAYESALDDIERALDHESGPPRYRLLQAEILVRLGQRGKAASANSTACVR